MWWRLIFTKSGSYQFHDVFWSEASKIMGWIQKCMQIKKMAS